MHGMTGESHQVGHGDAKDGGDDPGGRAGGKPQVEQARHPPRLAQETAAGGTQVG